MPNGYRFTTGTVYWGTVTPLRLDPACQHGNCQISLPRWRWAAHHYSSAVFIYPTVVSRCHRENLDSGWPVQQVASVHRMDRSSVRRFDIKWWWRAHVHSRVGGASRRRAATFGNRGRGRVTVRSSGVDGSPRRHNHTMRGACCVLEMYR